MIEEKLSYRETERRFDVVRSRITAWERIYLTDGPEGFAIKRRGRGSAGRPKKLPKEVEEDLLAEVQWLRAENAYLKNLQALVLENKRHRQKKHRCPKCNKKSWQKKVLSKEQPDLHLPDRKVSAMAKTIIQALGCDVYFADNDLSN